MTSTIPSIGCLVGEHERFAKKALRESCNQRRGRQHVLQRHSAVSVEASDLVGEFAGRQIGGLPKFAERRRLQSAPNVTLQLIRRAGIGNPHSVGSLQVACLPQILHELQ